MIPAHKNLTHPPGQIINHVNLEVPLEKAIEDYMKKPLGVPQNTLMTQQELEQSIQIGLQTSQIDAQALEISELRG